MKPEVIKKTRSADIAFVFGIIALSLALLGVILFFFDGWLGVILYLFSIYVSVPGVIIGIIGIAKDGGKKATAGLIMSSLVIIAYVVIYKSIFPHM